MVWTYVRGCADGRVYIEYGKVGRTKPDFICYMSPSAAAELAIALAKHAGPELMFERAFKDLQLED